MSYFPKPSLNENDLAIIERGDTAAHSIDAGQYVSWHGKTGKAKAAILQGATLDDTLFDYDEDGALNSKSGWTYIGRFTANINFTIPEAYENVLICLVYTESGRGDFIRISSVYPVELLETAAAVELNAYTNARVYVSIGKVSRRTYRYTSYSNVHAIFVYAQ